MDDKLHIYRENFEKTYIKATESFYKTNAPEYLRLHGVESYMKYAETKLKEEEMRAQKYLEAGGNSVQSVCYQFYHFLFVSNQSCGCIKLNFLPLAY